MTLTLGLQRIENFIERTKAAERSRPRLIFALDATASRQPTWNEASELQAEMFRAAGNAVEVQLLFYRGAECKASGWLRDQAELLRLMRKIECKGGWTQIGRMLAHALREIDNHAIRALVFVGDAFEEEIDAVKERAAALGKKGVPIFMFQEGSREDVAGSFQEIAEVSDGIFVRFDQGSAKQLAGLLRTVGKFAVSNDFAALSHARKSLLMLSKT
jgi:hypothetical protein